MWKKISSVVVVVIILVSYNHCGVPKSSSKKGVLLTKSSSELDNTDTSSYNRPSNHTEPSVEVVNDIEIFSKTLWQLTKLRCASCHNSSQQPLHASSDVNIAYKAVVDGFKVNFSTPSLSRMVLKLRDESHNCWSNCFDNSNEILDEVSKWAQKRNSAVESNVSPSESFITEESMSLSQALNYNGNDDFIKFDPPSMIINQSFTRARSGEIDYIYSKSTEVLKRSNDNNAGSAFINFTVKRTAGYKMWVLVDTKASEGNSLYIKLNDQSYIEWYIPKTNGFEWRRVTDKSTRSPVNLFASQGGPNKLEIKQRKGEVKVSSVVLSDEIEQGVDLLDAETTVTFRFDISSMLKLKADTVALEIDCKEFDEYTYQFSNPRVVSTSNSSISLKGIKLFINGNYSPQHSTYKLVNTTISRGTTILSKSALIALKERGSDSDRFSFSFDEIELK